MAQRLSLCDVRPSHGLDRIKDDLLNESTVEEAALSWFGELGYAAAHGPDIGPVRIPRGRTEGSVNCGRAKRRVLESRRIKGDILLF